VQNELTNLPQTILHAHKYNGSL